MLALRQAQQQVVGALLLDPSLFDRPLTAGRHAGRTLDEAMPPDEFIHNDLRALYRHLYTYLGTHDDIHALTHTDLLSHLAEHSNSMPQTPSPTPAPVNPVPDHAPINTTLDMPTQADLIDLAGLATACQQRVAHMTDSAEALMRERIAELLAGSVDTIADFHEDRDRQNQLRLTPLHQSDTLDAEQLQRFADQRKQKSSPARIFRSTPPTS